MIPQVDPLADARTQRREARRKKILEAALEAFTAQGFTPTRLDDVAERAGIGKGTIYLYFDSKEGLFEEVVRAYLFPARDEVENRLADFQGSASELLESHLKTVYGLVADERIPPLIAMILGEGNRFPKLTEFFFRELASRTQDVMRTIIDRGVASGEFRKTDAGKYTQILVGPALMSALWKLQFQQIAPIDLEAYARAHLDIILHGLKKGR